MRKGIVILSTAVFVLTIATIGCSRPTPAESSRAAISKAAAMDTVEKKLNYLVDQAKTMYKSEKFQDSIDIARYILRWVDKDSQIAKDILRDAQEALRAKAQDAFSGMKKTMTEAGN
jgi:vancomycin resistance protein YoaR